MKSWCCSGNISLGLAFLLIGLFFLAKDLGWIPNDISGWAILFIILGLCFLAGNYRAGRSK